MKKQLLLNLFKNHSWLEIGLESLWAAIILEYTQRPFIYPKVDPIGHLMRHIGDQFVPIIFTAVGTYCIVLALFNLHKMYAEQIGLGISMFAFTILFMAFLLHDIDMGTMSWMTGFLLIIIFRIILKSILRPVMLKLSQDIVDDKWKGGK